MDLKIAGKNALVTGASRGIGKAVCQNLLQEGVNVIGVSRNTFQIEKFKPNEDKPTFIALEIDLSGSHAIKKLKDSLSKLDFIPEIVINNIGGNLGITNPMCTYTEFMEVMRFNFGISMEINNCFIPAMIEKKWGRICHVSSISAIENQGPPAYGAAKAAINAYVRSLSRFLSANNVVLNSVMPGAIFTEGGYWDTVTKEKPEHLAKYLEERMAIKRLGNVEEVSKLITFLVSEYSSFMVGSNVLVDGGQGRSFPNIE